MFASLLGVVISFVVVSLLFWTLERLWPAVTDKRVLRAGFWTDVCYWAFTPLVGKAMTRVALAVVLAPTLALALWLSGRGVSREGIESLTRGIGPVGRQPVWLQAIEMLLIGDFIAYWVHRMFHRGRWWPFHAVHHSSTQLDWLGSVRLHPVNEIVTRVAQAAALLAMGFSVTAVGGVAGFLTLYAIMLHANVDWDFGPLRGVIASPCFHRWHHTREAEALDKNFAGFFPVWDRLFGTYYMPRDKRPRDFGVTEHVPSTLWGQLAYPFKAWAKG